MDSKTDKLVQTIVTHSNDRLKPVMRAFHVLCLHADCKGLASNTIQAWEA